VAEQLHEYTVILNGARTTVMLSESDAAKVGGVRVVRAKPMPVEVPPVATATQAAVATTTRAPSDKARRPRQ